MYFGINSDDGKAIVGFFAPDNPVASATIEVIVNGEVRAARQTWMPRPDIVELGIHSSGLVGFRFDETDVEGLAYCTDVKLRDRDSGLLFFSRRRSTDIDRGVFIFDASLLVPDTRIIANAQRHFSLVHWQLASKSLETMLVMVTNFFNTSQFFWGAQNLSRIQQHIVEREYVVGAMLRQPFEDLAESLAVLAILASPSGERHRGAVPKTHWSLLEFAAALDFTDRKALSASFDRLSREQRLALVSPMTRMLACTPDQTPTWRSISIALDHLATMNVVATRDRFSLFGALLEPLIGVDLLRGCEARSDRIAELAQTLGTISAVEDLVAEDLELYKAVSAAVETTRAP